MKDNSTTGGNLNLLRNIALILTLCGALGSLMMMFHAGRNNKSVILMAIFAIWVLSPFLTLMIAVIRFRQWPQAALRTLYILMISITLISLVGFSGVWRPPGTKTAFVFLVIPFLSWIIMGVVYIAARSKNKDRH